MSINQMSLAEIALACGGQYDAKNTDCKVKGITTDSRKSCANQLFVALRGNRFDAHDFVEQALNQGASAALVERDIDADVPTIKVENTLTALGHIAAWWRSQFVVPVIGITGSVGKTTVKEMTASIFIESGQGLITTGNLNNDIGVPLTLLRFKQDDAYAVIEMGMSHAGEIAYLSKLVRPTIALINNAAAAHLEGLGTVAAVAEAKGEIFEGLDENGVAVINVDDRYAQLWLALAESKRVITFGLDGSADVSASCELFKEYSLVHATALSDQFTFRLSVPGKHNVANALAAIAVAVAKGCSVNQIIQGLEKYRPIAGRLKTLKAGRLTIIDDTYNANPASMRAAVDVLAAHQNATLILGDMGELGMSTQAEHESLGAYISSRGISRVLACGSFAPFVAEGSGGKMEGVFSNQTELLDYLEGNPVVNGTVLLKGSRSAKMERVVEYLVTVNESQSECTLVGEER